MTPEEIEQLERDNYEKSMGPPNPDHILGLLRFALEHLELDVSSISLRYTEIFTDHRDDLESLESVNGAGIAPADAIYDMLLELFEID